MLAAPEYQVRRQKLMGKRQRFDSSRRHVLANSIFSFFSLPSSRQNKLNMHNGTKLVSKGRRISCRGLGGWPKNGIFPY
jgi:hypothetical protein